MTKEKLKKEAEVFATYYESLFPNEFETFYKAFLKVAEPREKQIEELETENNKLLDVINNQDVKIADLEKENAGLDMKRKAERQIFQGIVEKKNEQLTKAKEIIEDFMITETGGIGYSELYDKAEQFLKEIEK